MPELWINRFFSTSSRVYVRFNSLNKPCFWTGAKLDKKSACVQRGSSAHSILWIFIGLSTDSGGVAGAWAIFDRIRRCSGGRQADWSTSPRLQKRRQGRSRSIFAVGPCSSIRDQDDKKPAAVEFIGVAVCSSRADVGVSSGHGNRSVDAEKVTQQTVERSKSSMRLVCAVEPKPAFFGGAGAFAADPQVYNQKLVYKMMVVVNGTALLWISQVLSTTSNVYGSHKAVGWSCMFLVAKLDKKRGCAKSRVSSQSVPVDIHTLIHRLQTLIGP